MSKEKVTHFNAKNNKLFPRPWNDLVVFARYENPRPCEFCGKKRKHFWTLGVSFRVADMQPYVIKPSEKIFEAGAPVCRKHLLVPSDNT